MTEFITWELLVTNGGALVMVGMLTQFTKEWVIVKKLPTQVWSYILALLVLFPALAFLDQLTLNTAVQTLFNGVIVSIAANGGYSVLTRLTGKNISGTLDVDQTAPDKDAYFIHIDDLDSLASKKTVTLAVSKK